MAYPSPETGTGRKKRRQDGETGPEETPIFVAQGVMKEDFPDTGFVEEYDEGEGSFVPQGALTFVMLMLTGYVIYWGYVWFIIIERR
jgi:hypothetical protein